MTRQEPSSAAASNDEREPTESLPLREGKDHAINWRRGLSWQRYPKDCPSLSVQWFHAVDVPKRNPLSSAPVDVDKKSKKYVPFSSGDSRAIEDAYQKLLEEGENKKSKVARNGSNEEKTSNTSREHEHPGDSASTEAEVKVPVNEDYLFDVDLDQRELAPAYWLGPVYDVRRGTWFFVENSRYRPCDENLGAQLEEGYLKLKPWKQSNYKPDISSSQKEKPDAAVPEGQADKKSGLATDVAVLTKETQGTDQVSEAISVDDSLDQANKPNEDIRVHRLFGAYATSVASYQDDKTAYIVTDDFLSRMSGTLYEKIGGKSHYAGIKVARGYLRPSEHTKETKPDREVANTGDEDQKRGRTSEIAADNVEDDKVKEQLKINKAVTSEIPNDIIDRKLSTLITSKASEDSSRQEKVAQSRDNKQIKDEYKGFEGEDQHREIEHLILAVHGIGQRLSLRMESVNFIHDINTLRKSLKAVFAGSPDLQALHPNADDKIKNCKIQVLPICWRHLLDFPRQSLKFNRDEHDLSEANIDENEYPKLHDITVQGVPAMRNLITDLALDILLYQSVAYKGHIASIVAEECNRIYELFRKRNPEFKGRVSIVGHSLGSAIVFDILCNQGSKEPRDYPPELKSVQEGSLNLKFNVEDFYALGSPIGLFEMLNGHRIAAHKASSGEAKTASELSKLNLIAQHAKSSLFKESEVEAVKDITTSRPKLQQLFNIFHPQDPISYRIEPLVSTSMSALKPMPLPYTKRGLFDAPMGQGLTGISSRVGQSFSGLWTSLSSGLAGSLINRSVGMPVDNPVRENPKGGTNPPQAMTGAQGRGTNMAESVTGLRSNNQSSLPFDGSAGSAERSESDDTSAANNQSDTLFANFQTFLGDHQKSREEEIKRGETGEKSQLSAELRMKMQAEEAKVKALNKNGRLDYSIQEGAFDISLIASIASHLSYWADEDVSHFIMSQLLSRQVKPKNSEKLAESGKL